MKLLSPQIRLLLCVLIIAAFFVPSYDNISGFSFIYLALDEAKTHHEITYIDVLIALTPMVLIPLSALVILVRTLRRLSTRKTYLALPIIFLSFFTGILLLSTQNSSSNFSSMNVLLQMQVGFYLVGAASILLVFTKDYRRKRVKRPNTSEVEVAV